MGSEFCVLVQQRSQRKGGAAAAPKPPNPQPPSTAMDDDDAMAADAGVAAAHASYYNELDFAEPCPDARIHADLLLPLQGDVPLEPDARDVVARVGQSHVVFAADIAARLTSRRHAINDANERREYLAFCDGVLAEMRAYVAAHAANIAEQLYQSFTELVSDNALVGDYDQYAPVGTSTARLLAAVTLYPALALSPAQQSTRLLYDSVRKPYLKAHAFPLERLAPATTLKWLTHFADNGAPMNVNGNATTAALFAAAVTADGDAAALREYLNACFRTAHGNVLAICRDFRTNERYRKAYKYVALQMVLYRVDVVNAREDTAATLTANVRYRVVNVVAPFSRNAADTNRRDGFSGALYYRYERSSRAQRVEPRSRAANARGTRNQYWGIIGSRKFWKHYDAVRTPGARRAIHILTELATEQEQMDAYVRLLGVVPRDAPLGKLVYAVACTSVTARNMGMLRTFYSFVDEALPEGGDVRGAATQPLSTYLAYDAASQLLALTPAAKALPRFHDPARSARRRPAADGSCAGNPDSARLMRGSVDNLNLAWFTAHTVTAAGGRCRGVDATTSVAWLSMTAVRAVMDVDALERAVKLRQCALRMLLSAWKRRSYAVTGKCYVRCFQDDADAGAGAGAPAVYKAPEPCDIPNARRLLRWSRHALTQDEAQERFARVADALAGLAA